MTSTEEATPCSRAVKKARAEGRLGLTLYLIPGFPSLALYEELFGLLEDDDAVSVIETALPITSGFADYQNPLIRRAHAVGRASFPDGSVPATLLKRKKATFCVIYGESVQTFGLEGVLEKHRGGFDAVVFEQGSGNVFENAKVTRRYGVETLKTIAVDDLPKKELQWVARTADPGGYIYLATALGTGGELASNEAIERHCAWIKESRPDVSISAGFGVKTAADVRRLAEVDGLDGVIMGTTFLAAIEKGLNAAEDYLSEIREALTRPR